METAQPYHLPRDVVRESFSNKKLIQFLFSVKNKKMLMKVTRALVVNARVNLRDLIMTTSSGKKTSARFFH